jgi:two-component system cell cycle response regulator
MTTLVHAVTTVRNGARRSFGHITAACIALLLLLGAFDPPATLAIEHLLLAAAWAAVFSARAHARIRDTKRGIAEGFVDFELGCLLLCAAHVVLQRCGGLLSPLYPIMYVLVAFVGSFAGRADGRLIVLAAVAFEAPLYFFTEGQRDPKPYALHAIFLALFGLINSIFTQAELTRVRLLTQRERAEERRRVTQEARLFRLAAKPPTTAARDEEHLWRGSVSEVRTMLYWNLALLKRTLGLHSALLLLRDQHDGQLRVVESISDSAHGIEPGPFPPGEGAVGAVYQRGVAMRLDPLRPSHPGLHYYRDKHEPVRGFVALPVRDHEEIIGVLCADRVEDRAFTPLDEELLHSGVEHILRALENERVFVQLERSKREQDVLYEASRALGAAQTEDAVLNAALHAASQMVVHDFAAVTHYDAHSREHSIRRALGEGAVRAQNVRFRDNNSLTSMAVQNKHYLPIRGDFDAQNQSVFTRTENLPGMHSLLIIPLCVRDNVLGTLIVAAKRRDAFPLDIRPALQLLANQLAVALSNAASVARLEALATTDGLTGCYNKRYFHDELTQRLHAAERFGRKVSLVIADIDHFKAVNDTYGHHTGDIVIRELGQILKRLRRGSDVVARFGGEEFCVLCEQTDTEGAVQLAERVRVALGQTAFDSERGELKVSCSLGVATFPDHAANKEALFEAADRALYAAKHAGRNQVRSA